MFSVIPNERPSLNSLISWTKNVSVYYLVRYALSRIESEGDKEQASRKSAAAAVLRRLDTLKQDDEETRSDDSRSRRPRKEDLKLNQYEQTVALDVVAPEDIAVKFEGEIHLFLDQVVGNEADRSLSL